MLDRLLQSLDPAGPPTLAFVRRAPQGIRCGNGSLLCLSASFNPITLAHCRLLAEGEAVARPDEILLLLAVANVDKPVSGLSLEQRIRLLERVAAGRPDTSIALASHGRFVDKTRAIRCYYPQRTRVHFLLGFDTLVRLFDPKYYVEREAELATLFEACEVLVANRAPSLPQEIARFLRRAEVAPYAGRVRAISLPPEVAAMSATAVRERLLRGEPVDGLVPPETLELLAGWGGREG